MRESKYRGHKIIYINNEWIYEDNMLPTVNTIRECGYCGKYNTIEGHDGCLGTIPNIMNACCGHGNNKEAYIQYWDGSIEEDPIILKSILDTLYTGW